MIALLLVLLVVLTVIALLMPLLFGAEIYRLRRGKRQVTCPETHKTVAVEIDARHSAATAVSGPEYMRLSSCTRWPSRADCDQDCVVELMAEEEREETPTGPHIAHLPVVVGALAAWFLGAVWYAEPVFGRAWMRLQGLDHKAAHWRAETIFPYLLTLAGFVTLGYVVEWLALRSGKSGLVRGAALGALLALAFVAAELALRPMLPGPRLPLTWVEGAYFLAGGAVAGSIAGGWGTLQRALSFG